MAKGTREKMWRKALVLTAVLVFLGFGAAAGSLFYWQIVRGEDMSSAALNQSLHSTTLPAMRGTIYDATGTKVLAQSASVWTVVLEPAYLYDDEDLRRTVSNGLAPILGLDAEDIYEKTGDGSSYYTVLKRQVETETRDQINKFLADNKIESGIRLIDDYKRYYPYGTVASNILGFTGTDGQGLGGVETYYDEELSGTEGRLISARNAWNTDMPFEYEQYVEAEDGHSLVLTIDETVQSILEKYLAEGLQTYMVQNGAVAVLMDVDTGAILGMATNPYYDPNDPFTVLDETLLDKVRADMEEDIEDELALAEASGDEDAIEELTIDEDAVYNQALNLQWRNKAVSDTYYPGSVYKMCVGAMALEEGVVTLDSTFTCTGNMPVEGVEGGINCWKREGHGLETFAAGIYNSCNPWMIHIGQLLGADTFCKYREAFGMTESTGIDLPGEAATMYHAYEDMVPADLAVESFGQNFAITAVHMITAASAIANGGYLVQPHVVDRILDSDGNIVSTADTSYRRQVISEETSRAIIDILQYNAESGSATGGYVAGYRIAGKTGTTEKIADWNASNSDVKTYIASYCGFAPAEDPKYALLVFFDEPNWEENGVGNGGNAVAGPIFAKIMEEVLPYLGVEAQYNEEEAELLDTTAPSVTGMTLDQAYAVLEEAGLSYTVLGDESDGSIAVTQQVPQGGTAVPKEGQVVLYTSGYDEASTLVTVPDFTGLDLVNANYVASLSGLQVSVSGSTGEGATVTSQALEEGEQVPMGTVISLTFVNNSNAETTA